MSRPPSFPFSAVVGHDDAKLALTLVAADPAIGGVLLRGAKGSAKTTLARGLAALLGDDAPFVELPLGATEDRVVGSLDLAAALTGGEVRFQPGLLAAAHGGVLYVDEVNLLADHLVDVLLDVAASGTNQVEREGVSHAHPSRFVLVGSMNPEEGELRPQLLDRFGLAVDVAPTFDADERAEAVARRLAFDADPAAVATVWAEVDHGVRRRLAGAHDAVVEPGMRRAVSALCAEVGAESLRADLVICRAAAALAGLDGRDRADLDDVRRVAPLALAHRRRRQPLDAPGIDPDELDRALDRAHRATDQAPDSPPEDAPAEGTRPDSRLGDEPSAEEETPGQAPPDGRPGAPDAPSRVVSLGDGRVPTGPTGRRATVEGSRGRLVGDRVPDGAPASLAVGATVRAAAARRAGATDGGEQGGIALVEPGDLREAVRERRAGTLVVLAVDASGSMGAQRRMEAAKGAAVSLLLDAYQRRDRVALVTFRGDDAQVALRPTSSVEVARARLGELPTGGRTPLAAGIGAALELAVAAGRGSDASGGAGEGAHRPLVVLVSDGRATSAPDGADPVQAAQEAAAAVRRRGVPAVVVDAEGDGGPRLGLAADLAAAMGARYLTLADLSAGALTDVVRTSSG